MNENEELGFPEIDTQDDELRIDSPLTDVFTGTANMIRTKLKTEQLYRPTEFSDAIGEIEEGDSDLREIKEYTIDFGESLTVNNVVKKLEKVTTITNDEEVSSYKADISFDLQNQAGEPVSIVGKDEQGNYIIQELTNEEESTSMAISGTSINELDTKVEEIVVVPNSEITSEKYKSVYYNEDSGVQTTMYIEISNVGGLFKYDYYTHHGDFKNGRYFFESFDEEGIKNNMFSEYWIYSDEDFKKFKTISGITRNNAYLYSCLSDNKWVQNDETGDVPETSIDIIMSRVHIYRLGNTWDDVIEEITIPAIPEVYKLKSFSYEIIDTATMNNDYDNRMGYFNATPKIVKTDGDTKLVFSYTSMNKINSILYGNMFFNGAIVDKFDFINLSGDYYYLIPNNIHITSENANRFAFVLCEIPQDFNYSFTTNLSEAYYQYLIVCNNRTYLSIYRDHDEYKQNVDFKISYYGSNNNLIQESSCGGDLWLSGVFYEYHDNMDLNRITRIIVEVNHEMNEYIIPFNNYIEDNFSMQEVKCNYFIVPQQSELSIEFNYSAPEKIKAIVNTYNSNDEIIETIKTSFKDWNRSVKITEIPARVDIELDPNPEPEYTHLNCNIYDDSGYSLENHAHLIITDDDTGNTLYDSTFDSSSIYDLEFEVDKNYTFNADCDGYGASNTLYVELETDSIDLCIPYTKTVNISFDIEDSNTGEFLSNANIELNINNDYFDTLTPENQVEIPLHLYNDCEIQAEVSCDGYETAYWSDVIDWDMDTAPIITLTPASDSELSINISITNNGEPIIAHDTIYKLLGFYEETGAFVELNHDVTSSGQVTFTYQNGAYDDFNYLGVAFICPDYDMTDRLENIPLNENFTETYRLSGNLRIEKNITDPVNVYVRVFDSAGNSKELDGPLSDIIIPYSDSTRSTPSETIWDDYGPIYKIVVQRNAPCNTPCSFLSGAASYWGYDYDIVSLDETRFYYGYEKDSPYRPSYYSGNVGFTSDCYLYINTSDYVEFPVSSDDPNIVIGTTILLSKVNPLHGNYQRNNSKLVLPLINRVNSYKRKYTAFDSNGNELYSRYTSDEINETVIQIDIDTSVVNSVLILNGHDLMSSEIENESPCNMNCDEYSSVGLISDNQLIFRDGGFITLQNIETATITGVNLLVEYTDETRDILFDNLVVSPQEDVYFTEYYQGDQERLIIFTLDSTKEFSKLIITGGDYTDWLQVGDNEYRNYNYEAIDSFTTDVSTVGHDNFIEVNGQHSWDSIIPDTYFGQYLVDMNNIYDEYGINCWKLSLTQHEDTYIIQEYDYSTPFRETLMIKVVLGDSTISE